MFLARSPIRSRSVATRKIDRHRLTLGNGQHRTFLDLVLQLVDIHIERHHLPAERNVATDQCVDGVDDLPFHQAAHLGDEPGQLLQIGIECFCGMF
jgi:hypothetical protein